MSTEIEKNKKNIFIRFKEHVEENGNSVLPAIAAINFAIIITLGSGSYLIAFDQTPIHRVFLWMSAFIVQVFFILGIFIYAGKHFGVFDHEGKISPRISFLAKASVITLAALMFLLSLNIVDSYFLPPSEINRNRLISTIIVLTSLITLGLLVIFFVMSMVQQTGFYSFITALLCTVCSTSISAGLYFDAYKSALVADSEYCYWLSSYKGQDLIDNSSKEDKYKIAAAEKKYLNDKTCNSQEDAKIFTNRYLVK